MQFVIDGSNFGSPVSLSPCSPSPNACATSGSTSTLSVGGSPHTIATNYTPTGTFTNSSGSLSGGQIVTRGNTNSTVVSSLNPSNYGQSVTFTATVVAVSPGTGTPTGTVDFKDGATVIASAVALSGGQAGFSTSSLSASTHSITAVYNGDGNFNATGTGGSTATALSQVVKPAVLTASIINNPTKPYDGNTNAILTASNYSLSGLVGSDSFTITQTTGSYNSKDVAAAATVTATLTAANFTPGGSTSTSNYALPTTASGPGHITAVTLSATITGNPAKPYDGNTTATLTSANFSLSGLVGTETFAVTKTTGTYNSKDVTAATTVSASLAAVDFTAGSGTLASNYTLPTTATGPGHITAVTLTASVVGNPTKPYDGNANATLTSANYSLAGLVGTESFTVTQTTGTYNSKDVLTASTVTATLVPANFTAAAGTLLTNYVLPTTASGAGHITAVTLTASIIGDPTRPYNGNANATLTSANYSLTGLVGTESISVSQTAGTYNSKDVVTANTVTATLAPANFTAAAGTLLTNYVLPTTASGAGHITAVTLTASIIGNPTKPYDGNTNATLAAANYSLTGLVGTESISVSQTAGTYNSKDVVTANTVTATLAPANFTAAAGTLLTNYVLPTTASGTGHITAVTLTASIIGNPTKPYDGNTNATLAAANYSLTGLVGTESISISQTAEPTTAKT